MTDRVADGLEALAAAALDAPAPDAAKDILRLVLARGGQSVAAVLFYGACRRENSGQGLLDLYVLYDRHRDFHGSTVMAALTSLLPPHVVFVEAEEGAATAKVATLSRAQFARRVRLRSLDTSIWARFCQPATLLYARDAEARRWVAATLACAIRTAACWALRLGPATGGPACCWQHLFARTYGAELRPERRNRPALIYGSAPGWFDQAIALVRTEMLAAKRLPPRRLRRGAWQASWFARRLLGKPLNLARLVKAALTFENGTDYVLSKLGRHAAVRIVPTAWQRRHPLLAAPVLLWRIRSRR